MNTWELNEFDSEIFGFRTAKITRIDTVPSISKSIDLLLTNLKTNHIVYSTYRIPSNAIECIHTLESKGFRIIDATICFDRTIGNDIPALLPREGAVVIAQKRDIPELKKIAGSIFTISRFYFDPVTRPFAAKEFETWIENAVNKVSADRTFIHKIDGKITGFIALRNDGHIVLVGVNDVYQGKHIAQTLIYHALEWLRISGIMTSHIETHIHNIAALRTYESCGYKTCETLMTLRYHFI